MSARGLRGSRKVLRPPTPKDIADARELHNEYDMGPGEITMWLRARGVNAHRPTVGYWINETLADRHRQHDRQSTAQRRAEESGGVLKGRPRSVEFRMVRMRALADIGIPWSSIAKILAFDQLGPELNEREVRQALKTGRPPRKWRREAA